MVPARSPMGQIIGVSVILWEDGRLLFEIEKPARWRRHPDGTLVISLGCIGGRVEEGETPVRTLKREIREEIGCGVVHGRPAHPFAVDHEGTVTPLDPGDVPVGALFLWERREPGFIEGARVAVFAGRLSDGAVPGDVPAIISMTPGTLFACEEGALTIQDVFARGAVMREREPFP